MTIPNQHDDLEALEREAHRWVAQLVSGEATTADAEALKQWRRQSPAHEEAFLAATRRWKDFRPAAWIGSACSGVRCSATGRSSMRIRDMCTPLCVVWWFARGAKPPESIVGREEAGPP